MKHILCNAHLYAIHILLFFIFFNLELFTFFLKYIFLDIDIFYLEYMQKKTNLP